MNTPTDLESLTAQQRLRALNRAINGLRERDPLLSASAALMGWQRSVLPALACLVAACMLVWPWATATVLVGLSTVAYVFTMTDRVLIFQRGLASKPVQISDEAARAIPDEELPAYTILVPAYHEPEVVADLLGAIENLEYPADKLQVLLLLEEDDDITIEAARAALDGADPQAAEPITILLVPPAEPRTKPKACNYGLEFATGELVTIYDAEDLPEPLQLRRVAAAYRQLPDDVVCVQAKLVYHNGHQNLLTAWFTAEYGLWFGYLLPGLMHSSAPIPLGGTSNHLRRDQLVELGAWDPYNVTEDADLGLRIAAFGYRTAVIDSATLEEANSDPINWVRQRSRWYKGYLQTWLVHIRRPVQLYRTIGLRSFLRFTMILAGTPIVAVLNLAFWLIAILWFLGQPSAVGAVFPWYIYFPALAAMILGNAATMYMNLIALREDDRADLLHAALTVPLFWLMMSIAAAKGLYQLIRQPSYWEKTFHGLANRPATEPT